MHGHENSYGYSWLWVVVVVVFLVVLVIAFYAAGTHNENPLFLAPSASLSKDQLLNLPTAVLGKTIPSKYVNKCPLALRTPVFQTLQTEEEAQKSVVFPSECLQGMVRLSGEQEVPPVRTKGRGKGYVTVDSRKERVTYDIHVKKLSSDIDEAIGAHFHLGSRGENGPAVKDLKVVESRGCAYYQLKGKWTPDDVKQPLTQADLDALLRGDVYVNVHTLKHPNGEVRGQVRF